MAIGCRAAATGVRPTNGLGARSWTKRFVARARTATARFFLWVHLFEPHAPYGDPADTHRTTPQQRYDDEITEADRQAGRLIDGARADPERDVVVAAARSRRSVRRARRDQSQHFRLRHDAAGSADHLRSWRAGGRSVDDRVVLIDVVPTVMGLSGIGRSMPMASTFARHLMGRRCRIARSMRSPSLRSLISAGARCMRCDRIRWKVH